MIKIIDSISWHANLLEGDSHSVMATMPIAYVVIVSVYDECGQRDSWLYGLDLNGFQVIQEY